MNQTKSLLQRVQSRIAKRRNFIFNLESTVMYYLNNGLSLNRRVKEIRANIKEEASSQQLDKKLMSMLLERSL